MAKYADILFRYRLRFLILFVVLPSELALACVFLFPHRVAMSSLWVDTPAYISVSAAATGWNQYLTPAQNTVDALNQLRSTASFVKTLGAEDIAHIVSKWTGIPVSKLEEAEMQKLTGGLALPGGMKLPF